MRMTLQPSSQITQLLAVRSRIQYHCSNPFTLKEGLKWKVSHIPGEYTNNWAKSYEVVLLPFSWGFLQKWHRHQNTRKGFVAENPKQREEPPHSLDLGAYLSEGGIPQDTPLILAPYQLGQAKELPSMLVFVNLIQRCLSFHIHYLGMLNTRLRLCESQ